MGIATLFAGLRPPPEQPAPQPELPSPTPALHPDPVIRGQRAENLLNDPMLKAAFESVREKYRAEWESSSPGDIDSQQLAHIKLHALKDVLRDIKVHIQGANFIKETAKRATQNERQSDAE